MPASNQLNTWIAESDSWQSFIDFNLPKDAIAAYSFLKTYDNFYLSLMSRAIELIKDENKESKNDEILAVAKGLEIFSLLLKKDSFLVLTILTIFFMLQVYIISQIIQPQRGYCPIYIK